MSVASAANGLLSSANGILPSAYGVASSANQSNQNEATNMTSKSTAGVPFITTMTNSVNVHTLSCGTGFSVNYESDTGKVTCVPTQGFTSNVNGFKSRKGRRVESFSQNTNGKCKSKY